MAFASDIGAVPTPSMLSTGVFLLTVLLVAALFAGEWWRMASGPGRLGVPILVLVGWLAVPGVLARAGALDRYSPLPAPALILIAAITVGTVVLAFSSVGERFASGVPLAGLVGFQVFRVAVEWVLHRLYVEGIVPVEMTYSGRNFDIVYGITAGLVALWLRSGRGGRRLVLAWNILGLALLLHIVLIAVLSTPVPFRHFDNEPANLLPSTFPYVWLPSFLVQAALFGHLVVFRALGRKELA